MLLEYRRGDIPIIDCGASVSRRPQCINGHHYWWDLRHEFPVCQKLSEFFACNAKLESEFSVSGLDFKKNRAGKLDKDIMMYMSDSEVLKSSINSWIFTIYGSVHRIPPNDEVLLQVNI